MVSATTEMAPFAEDFTVVVEALRDFTQATGRVPVLLGGWEVEDAAIAPPPSLARKLATVPHQPIHYTYSRDFHAAREQAAALFSRTMRVDGEAITPAQLAIVPNSSQGLLLALTALREAGMTRAVIASPTYYGAVAVCRHLGLTCTFIPTLDYLTGALDVSRIAVAMRDPAAVLLLTNPAYSLGVEYTPEQLQTLFAALPANASVLLDETRLGLHWQSDQPWYPMDFPANTIILRSPSKIFLLNGAKTSILIAPPHLVRQMERLSEALLGSVAGNAQAVTVAYLEAWERWWGELDGHRVGPMRRWKRGVVTAFQQNLTQIRAMLAPYDCAISPVDSGPYALVGLTNRLQPRLHSYRIAHEQGVLLMTSDYFYHHHPAWQGFRMNLSCCPIQARKGITRVFGG